MSAAPCDLSATAARDAIAMVTLSAVDLARSCLERIAAREPELQAWAAIDSDLWLDAAAKSDAAGNPGRLGGLPLGVKDLAATRDWPTTCGSPIYAGVHAPFDAVVVALTRLAGGVIAGKTVTTEFAAFNPGPTRNPRDPERTPGGSSSGSAAAVAAGMVPFAVGTQTAGSIVRPASYCGVFGYKPSFGLIDATGIKPYAPSLDTVGVLARAAADCRLFAEAVSGVDLGVSERRRPTRIGWCRSPAWSGATDAMRHVFEFVLPERMRDARFTPVEVDLPPLFDEAMEAQKAIMAWEAARALSFERECHADLLSPGLRERLAAGAAMRPATVQEAYRVRDAAIAAFPMALDGHDVAALVTPSAPGVAPRFADGTGSPDFNRLWTLLRGPCVQVPGLLCSETGLPLGVQVVAPLGADARLLAIAERLGETLAA
jgi:Asp-tRNA(Asn)/Glu-tRNA(Gln) amidotransferase A subunit family amidase